MRRMLLMMILKLDSASSMPENQVIRFLSSMKVSIIVTLLWHLLLPSECLQDKKLTRLQLNLISISCPALSFWYLTKLKRLYFRTQSILRNLWKLSTRPLKNCQTWMTSPDWKKSILVRVHLNYQSMSGKTLFCKSLRIQIWTSFMINIVVKMCLEQLLCQKFTKIGQKQ